MPTPPQWQRRLLITELTALLILIGSLYVLGQGGDAHEPRARAWLLVPALASLVMFVSFLGLMYLRWLSQAAAGVRLRIHQVIFGFMTLVLLSLWAMAMVQTWHSLNDTV